MTEPQARLLIRISASLKAKLVELAKQERRSLNKQIEFLLERGVLCEEKSETSGPLPPKDTRRRRK
jgi:hypothetical protein